MTAASSSSSQIVRRFSPSPHQYRARGSAGDLGRVRWMRRGEMRQLRGAGVVCGFIYPKK
jgi:hypothetical protein